MITNNNPNEIIIARGEGGVVIGTCAHACARALEAVPFNGSVSDEQSYLGISWTCYSENWEMEKRLASWVWFTVWISMVSESRSSIASKYLPCSTWISNGAVLMTSTRQPK